MRGERLQTILDKRFNGTVRRAPRSAPPRTTRTRGLRGRLVGPGGRGEGRPDPGRRVLEEGRWPAGRTSPTTTGDGWLWLAEKHIADINALDARAGRGPRRGRRGPGPGDCRGSSTRRSPSHVARLAVRYDGERHLKTPRPRIDPNRTPLPFVKDPAKAREGVGHPRRPDQGASPSSTSGTCSPSGSGSTTPMRRPTPALAERVKMLTDADGRRRSSGVGPGRGQCRTCASSSGTAGTVAGT